MAKIQILGDAVVLTSEITLEDLRTIAKYRPEALTLKGGEDGKTPVFAIGVDGVESFTKFGVTFKSASRDDKKYAQLTQIICDRKIENLTEVIADHYGAGLAKLNELEATLPAVLDEVRAEREAIMQSISIVTCDAEPCDCGACDEVTE